MRKTSPACFGNHKTVHRALIAGVMQDIDNIRSLKRLDGVFCPFLDYMALLVYAAPCGGLGARNELFGGGLRAKRRMDFGPYRKVRGAVQI